MIVADINVILPLLVETEVSTYSHAALQKDSHWAVPTLWRHEFSNVLAIHVRHEVIDLGHALGNQVIAETLFAGREYELESALVLRLAIESRCTAYDCEYVALARELEVPLLTLDRQVLRAFPETAVSLKDFVAG